MMFASIATMKILIENTSLQHSSLPKIVFHAISDDLYSWMLSLCCYIVVFYIAFALWVFNDIYVRHFGGKRLSREHNRCPTSSNLDPPSVKNWRHNQMQVLQGAQRHQTNFATCGLMEGVEMVDHARQQFKQQDAKTQKAAVLDMDHIYLSFSQVLWAFTFVGPFSYLLWQKNTMLLRLRTFLVKMGLLKKKEVDLEAVVGKLVLEQSQAIHYFTKSYDESKQGKKVAGFFFTDFPYVNNKGKMQVADLFAIGIDLETRKMVECKMDDDTLNASEALILLWYNTISAQHVKLHAFGNWGVNIGDDSKAVNPFLHTNSLVTVVYNYFGFTSFPTFFDTWKKKGLLSKDWDPKALTQTFVHGVSENIWQHSHIVELVNHSDFINFVTKTRSIFHAEFAKYKHLFPNVNPEGLFTGTVLHSLDHALMEWNLEDPLWLDVDDPRFGKMAELGRIVRVGFVPEVPGYYFHHHFKGSGHPFYEAVYSKAAKINKKFADHMDTCICR